MVRLVHVSYTIVSNEFPTGHKRRLKTRGITLSLHQREISEPRAKTPRRRKDARDGAERTEHPNRRVSRILINCRCRGKSVVRRTNNPRKQHSRRTCIRGNDYVMNSRATQFGVRLGEFAVDGEEGDDTAFRREHALHRRDRLVSRDVRVCRGK